MMKRKVVLMLVLLALLALVTTSVVTADQGGPGGPYGYGVVIAAGYVQDGVRVGTYQNYCPWACSPGGRGYRVRIGHGATKAACMADSAEHPVPNLVRVGSSRLYPWYEDQHPEVGEYACIHWCCQPVPAYMYFHYEFEVITQ